MKSKNHDECLFYCARHLLSGMKQKTEIMKKVSTNYFHFLITVVVVVVKTTLVLNSFN